MYNKMYIKLIAFTLSLLSVNAQAQNVFPTPSGSVGIGTNSPSALLHVHNPTNLGTSVGNTVELARFSGINVNISQLRFQLNRYASGNDWYSASMRLQHVIDYTNTGYIEFDPVNGNAGVAIGSGSNEIARFLPSGNVGIGTTSPFSKLDVAGALSIGAGSVNPNTTKLFLRNPAGKTWAISSGLNMVNEPNFGIYNWTDQSQASTPLPFLSISNGGNVGIGTATPSSKLTIDPQGAGTILIGNPNTGNGGYTSLLLGISAQSGGYAYVQGTSSSGSSYGTMSLNPVGGNVLIGKTSQVNAGYLLDVNGATRANKVVVNTTGADFVFDSSYKLKDLTEVETFIGTNKHLPEIESAADMQKDGLDLGANQTKLLQKIEELTLYLIEQKKEIVLLQKAVEQLKKKN